MIPGFIVKIAQLPGWVISRIPTSGTGEWVASPVLVARRRVMGEIARHGRDVTALLNELRTGSLPKTGKVGSAWPCGPGGVPDNGD